jgi:hypothetical protein
MLHARTIHFNNGGSVAIDETKPKSVSATSADFQLTPPEVVIPVGQAVAKTAVPMPPALTGAVEEQVDRFVHSLMTEDLQSDGFRAKLDSAFALGREEVSVAASLMQGRFMERNFVGVEDNQTFKAIQEMRGHLDELNPGKEGDLFQPQKLLGIIPFGNRLQTYFRKFQSAGGQLQKSMNLFSSVTPI